LVTTSFQLKGRAISYYLQRFGIYVDEELIAGES